MRFYEAELLLKKASKLLIFTTFKSKLRGIIFKQFPLKTDTKSLSTKVFINDGNLSKNTKIHYS